MGCRLLKGQGGEEGSSGQQHRWWWRLRGFAGERRVGMVLIVTEREGLTGSTMMCGGGTVGERVCGGAGVRRVQPGVLQLVRALAAG